MSKTSGALSLLGILLVALSLEGFGLLLVVLAAMFFVGTALGANGALLTIYIIGAMSLSYLIPLVLILSCKWKNVWQALVILFLANFIFMFPSSFITVGGCKAGHESAMWAMRAIPIWWAADTIATPHDGRMTCHTWVGTP